MNPETPSPKVAKSERRLLRWLLIGLAVMVTPVIVVACGVLSMLRLNHDAAILKQEVLAASEAGWHARVQINAGWCALTTLRTALRFVEHEQSAELRLALAAVRHASVGVYELTDDADWDREQLITRTDTRMRARGWDRLIGVTEKRDTVLIYGKEAGWSDDQIDVCLAVVNGRELVIVSTRIDADDLAKLAGQHIPKTVVREKLKLARF